MVSKANHDDTVKSKYSTKDDPEYPVFPFGLSQENRRKIMFDAEFSAFPFGLPKEKRNLDPLTLSRPKPKAEILGFTGDGMISLVEDPEEIIAKQLYNLLEKEIEEVQPDETKIPPQPKDEGGIYLFSSSTKLLRRADVEPPPVIKQPMKKLSLKRKLLDMSDSDTSDSEYEDERLKSVAVSSDWVLTDRLY